MQEYWEIYMKNIDGYPSSVLFNAGISMDIEKFKYIYTQVAFIKVKLKEANEKGLLSGDEKAKINYLEDKLEASLIKFRIGKYVGRVISNGYVTFIYYLQFTYNWQDFLNFALKDFTDYEITTGFRDDDEWNFYKNLLYPTTIEWQIIQNHKACEALELQNDNINRPRFLIHKCYFIEDINRRDELIEKLSKEGFDYVEEITHEEGYIGFSFTRIDKPYYYEIDNITLYLIELLSKYGATYDGWECDIIKDLD